MISYLNDIGLAPATPAFWSVFILLAAFVATAVFWRQASSRADALTRSLEEARLKLASAEQRADDAEKLEAALDHERRRRAAAENVSAAQEARLEEREKAIAEMKARLESEFKAKTACWNSGK